MIEIFKSLGKKKLFYALIALQFTVSLVYFFISMAAVQSAFYINIMVPKELDVSPERVVHLEINFGTDKDDFNNFVEEISKELVGSVGTYRTTWTTIDELGGDIAATEVDCNIDDMKEIKVAEGSYFEDSDFNYDETLNSRDYPMPVVVGYELTEQYNIELGDIFCDDTDTYYVVRGILEPESTWFFQTVSEGMILSLDNQLIFPKSEGIMLELHYYCVVTDNAVNQDVITNIEQSALKNDITLEATLVSDELEESFESSYNENMSWIVFVIVMSIMISIGTTILFMAQLNSRKRDIGVRISVGYSPKKITKLLIGEVLVVVGIAFILAVCIGKMLLGSEAEYFSGMSYSYGYYVSNEIIMLGSLLMFLMCIPAIVTLAIKIKRLQPRELIGGNE